MKNFESIKRLVFFYCGNKKHFANCNVYNLITFNNLFINWEKRVNGCGINSEVNREKPIYVRT